MKGKYGEPWGNDTRRALHRRGNLHNALGPKQAARAVACVNALDGLNPEAVEDVVKAVRDAVQILAFSPENFMIYNQLRDALRKLEAAKGEKDGYG